MPSHAVSFAFAIIVLRRFFIPVHCENTKKDVHLPQTEDRNYIARNE